MKDQLLKEAYRLGRFDSYCDSGLAFKTEKAKTAAMHHFLKTGELKTDGLTEKVAQQLMGGMPPGSMGMMPPGGGMMMPPGGDMGGMGMMPPTTQPGSSPAPMPPDQGAMMGGQPNPSQGEVLLIGGQVTNSDIKGLEKILNILKGLKMQYDEQQGMMSNAGAGAQPAGPAGGAPAPM